MTEESPVVVSVCVTCRSLDGPETDRPGADFLAALREAAGTALVARPVQCLGICKRPCTVALSGPGRYTYLFGDLDLAAGIPALLEIAPLYGAAERGYLLWRERPEVLRRTTIARIPPLGWTSPDGAHPR